MSATLHGERPRYEGGLHQVGSRAWAWLAPNGSWGEANAGLVVGDGAAALIDSLFDQRLARELLAAARSWLAGVPIELVVNTHSDGDHWWGNAEVPAAAEIVTSQASLEAMRAEASPSELLRLRRLSAVTGRLPGPAGAMGRYVGAMLSPFAFAEVRPRLPDRAFSGRQREQVGGRELELIELGPAHTPGDLVVHLPDAGVVFAADLLFAESTPVMWEGPLANWQAALETLLGLDADTYVPGHGPICDRTGVEALRDYWSWLEAAVATHHAAGRSAFATARAMTREPEFARYRAWVCPERMVISVTTAHRALSGSGPVSASPPARARLFAQVAALGRELSS